MKFSARVIRRFAIAPSLAAVATIVSSNPCLAIPENLHGTINVTGVSSQQDSITTESINQEYSLNWTKFITPLIQLRSAVRYNHLGVSQQASDDAWRRRFLPTVDLFWNHRVFDFTGSWFRQETSSNTSLTDIARTGYGLQWKSKLNRYPIVTLRFDRDRTYNSDDFNQRNTRDLRYQLTTNYDYKQHIFYYNLSVRRNQNRASGVNTNDLSHLLRWNQVSMLWHDKVRLSTGYNLSYRSTSVDVGKDTTILDPITIVRGLYAQDASPENGELATRSGLTDGNTETPVQPAIDLGQSQVAHNIGIDFGFIRQTDGIYIYTDRPSGQSVTWQVYTSPDNDNWDPVPAAVSYMFDDNFNRYEIIFDRIQTRYIKVVSGGINEVTTALVTEAVPLIEFTSEEIANRSQTTHQADLATTYYVSSRVTTTFDVTYQKETGGEFGQSRDQLYYIASLTHEPFTTLTQIVKFQSGFQKTDPNGIRDANRDLYYTLLYEPLSTLDFTLSAITRSNFIDGDRSNEINNVFLQTDGKLLETLSLSAEVGFSRNNRFDAGIRFDTWTYRVSGDIALLRSLHVTSSILRQNTEQAGTDSVRTRTQYTVGSTWRLTRNILLRGSYTENDDEQLSSSYRDFSASWSPTRSLALGFVYTGIDAGDLTRSDRYNARATLAVSARTSIFFNYNSTEVALGQRAKVEAYQLGIRSGF